LVTTPTTDHSNAHTQHHAWKRTRWSRTSRNRLSPSI